MNPASGYLSTRRKQSGNHSVTVLVVDDEPTIRELLTLMLGTRGWRILTAENGAEALDLARSAAGANIDILITDLRMPGMSGSDLALEVTLLHPGVRTLFMSGYSIDEIAEAGVDLSNSAYVSKPFRTKAINDALETLLPSAPVTHC